MRRHPLMIKIVAAAFVLSAAVAIGVVLAAGGSTAGASGGAWTWPEGIPGSPVMAPDAALSRSVSGSPGLVGSAVRQLLDTGSGRGRVAVYAAEGAGGTRCLAIRSEISVGGFSCADGSWNGTAVLLYQTSGGDSPGTVDRSTVIGVARNDVAFVVLTTAGGARRTLNLSKWRAFAYFAARPAAMPRQIEAYSTRGDVLQVTDVTPALPVEADIVG